MISDRWLDAEVKDDLRRLVVGGLRHKLGIATARCQLDLYKKTIRLLIYYLRSKGYATRYEFIPLQHTVVHYRRWKQWVYSRKGVLLTNSDLTDLVRNKIFNGSVDRVVFPKGSTWEFDMNYYSNKIVQMSVSNRNAVAGTSNFPFEMTVQRELMMEFVDWLSGVMAHKQSIRRPRFGAIEQLRQVDKLVEVLAARASTHSA